MYDIAIIGAGPGGYVAAIRAAQLGAKVALIEKDEIGGVCLNRGCIPTKAMIASAHALDAVKSASEFGIALSGDARVDMKAVNERKNGIVKDLRGGIEKLLKAWEIEGIKGEATFTSKTSIEVDGDTVEAKNFIIATGSSWIELPNIKLDGDKIITSDEALDFIDLPKTMVIVGGGVVGCEFACMLSSFGTEVTIIEAMPSILPPIEKGISRLLAKTMKDKGIKILAGTTIEKAAIEDDGVKCILSNGEEIMTDKVMVAVGRRPKFDSLNLDAAGIKLTDRGFIAVDDKLMTSGDGIYAIGDCKGGMMLAHQASAEGIAAVDDIMGKNHEAIDLNAIPSPIFTDPEIGSVGMNSDELKERNIGFETGRFPYAACGKALCDGDTNGQVIVHAEPSTGKIYGVHIFGKEATTLVAEAALAIKNGITIEQLENTIHAHPTLSEALAEAAGDVLGMAIHKVGRRRNG